MKADSEVKIDVEHELNWDPDIDPTDIGVAVKSNVVALTGYVRSYGQKWQAEQDAKRVAGVLGVANDLEVRLDAVAERPDPEIARDSVSAIKVQLPYAADSIKVIVEKAHIKLEGKVEWNYQKERAEEAVRRVKGVKGVANHISLAPKTSPTAVKEKIEAAFMRSAAIDAKRIMVEASGGEITLKGTVRAWSEREEAERAAYSAPGVVHVTNRIALGA